MECEVPEPNFKCHRRSSEYLHQFNITFFSFFILSYFLNINLQTSLLGIECRLMKEKVFFFYLSSIRN